MMDRWYGTFSTPSKPLDKSFILVKQLQISIQRFSFKTLEQWLTIVYVCESFFVIFKVISMISETHSSKYIRFSIRITLLAFFFLLASSVDIGSATPSYHLWVSISQIRQISVLIGKKSA